MERTDTVSTSGTTCALTILVVDDDPDMRYLARVVLEASGIRVAAEASDGPEAMLKLAELDPPPIPTVILLDNQMPGPTGLEVATQILAEIPGQLIVLFSGYLSDVTVAEATRVGVAACVSKIEAINLPDIIRAVVAARA